MTASPIRDASGKLAITPGVWRCVDGSIYSDNGEAPLDPIPYEGLCLGNLADGHLFAEAGTVTNATNCTPAELASLVRELREALAAYRKHDPYFVDDNLLAKSEGV